MRKLLQCVLLLALCTVDGVQVRESFRHRANPIRKVVTMLQMMQQKVEAEVLKESELHEKFRCSCKNSVGDVTKSIEEAQTKIPDLESEIEAGSSKLAQLKSDIKAHQADRHAAKSAMAEATSIREKDNAAFEHEKAEETADLTAVRAANDALHNGLGAVFLQSQSASALKKVLSKVESKFDSSDREDVLAFLSADDQSPGTSEILGILKEMSDEMASALSEAAASEAKAVEDFNALIAAKKKEISALSKMIEVKLQRVGDVSVQVTTAKIDLDETRTVLAEDEGFSSNLKETCNQREHDFDGAAKTRQDELLALAETIKVLNDDDALEMFKKTLPGASSFLQLQVTSTSMRSEALALLHGVEGRPGIDFIALRLQGKKIAFDKIVNLIDGMIEELRKEQTDDDDKKEYCAVQFDTADDKKKAAKREISDITTAMAKAEEEIGNLNTDIAELSAGIRQLDGSVADATQQRREENSNFKQTIADGGIAKQLLEFAKNRLNKFYNPKLYKAPPKRELSEEDRITQNMGGSIAPEEVGGIAGTGIGVSHIQTNVQKQESAGVIEMINLLIANLDKEMTVGKTEERDAQSDYERFIADSKKKRATDSKLLGDKSSAVAEVRSNLETMKGDDEFAQKSLMATMKYIISLHADCDFLLKYFDARKEARDAELDGLSKAKAVLNGADYSLFQVQQLKKRFLHLQ